MATRYKIVQGQTALPTVTLKDTKRRPQNIAGATAVKCTVKRIDDGSNLAVFTLATVDVVDDAAGQVKFPALPADIPLGTYSVRWYVTFQSTETMPYPSQDDFLLVVEAA